ncbi:LPXTG-motif cell wall-anchored protein [Promicromonospora sp. AC04]|uniref:LPXTG cell wall anchor domain-containing protein n=1 Tax=Promicromonospora sp. AC04 TaxID=2135723 RepID=UPI000D37C699|nr:LPXTG cell wall anchor domain-containing protein [Promicromonospora sp. AC04]PUB23570.1 LPXTG-motif cell wall-anchored protein [Promicromonospora sp. AC04]
MNCDLPRTGPDVDLGLLLILAIACLVVGAVFLLVARRRHRVSAALVLILAVGAALAPSSGTSAAAAAAECATPDNSLTVTVTSTMEGLAPGIAPVPITGLVVNNGTDSTHITAVTVEITFVTTDPGAPSGACGVGDYLLLDTTMAVGKRLGPGGSAPFDGASIGFADKATNQDACKHATVHLLFTANPGG